MEVIAIITSYNGSDCIEATLAAVLPQVDHIAIVDNASAEATIEVLRGLESDKITVIYNTENRGVAAALNQGIRYANGYYAAFTLDQDSVVLPGSVAALKAAIQSDSSIGIASTQYLVIVDGQVNGEWKKESGTCEVSTCWIAGSFVPLNVYSRAGLYREDFFLEYIDHEFNARVKAAGLKLVQVSQARLIQRLGTMTRVKRFWTDCITYNYPPVRHYWAARNGVIMVAEGYDSPASYIKGIANRTGKALLFERRKLKSLWMILKGMASGLLAASHHKSHA